MEEMSLETYDGIVVPASALRQQQRRERYGRVEGLPDEELVDPEELKRVMNKEMWWPILRLPQQRWECQIRPNMDEDGRLDWGAFGTADFESYRPQRSKLLYKVERMKDEQMDLVIRFEILGERIPGSGKYKILKLVRLGTLDVDDIENGDMWLLAKLYVRILGLQRQRYELLEKHRQRKKKEQQEFWGSMRC